MCVCGGGTPPPQEILFSRQDCYSVGRTAICVKYFRAKGKIEVVGLRKIIFSPGLPAPARQPLGSPVRQSVAGP